MVVVYSNQSYVSRILPHLGSEPGLSTQIQSDLNISYGSKNLQRNFERKKFIMIANLPGQIRKLLLARQLFPWTTMSVGTAVCSTFVLAPLKFGYTQTISWYTKVLFQILAHSYRVLLKCSFCILSKLDIWSLTYKCSFTQKI